MSEVRVGVIGLGFMGRTHVAAYAAAARAGHPCRLVAVADRDPARLADTRAAGGNLTTGDRAGLLFDPALVRAYPDEGGLLADPAVDLVSLCTPTETHTDVAIAALRAGKHVLVEKPVALNAADIRRVRDAARASGRLCMPGLCMRFWPAWTWLKRAVADASFGPVRSATFTRLATIPTWSGAYADPARCGGALIDLHIHDADFVLWCFGPPREVVSTGTLEHITTIYRYAPGRGPAHVAAEGGWDQAPGFGFRMRYLVNFERATAEFDLARDPQLMLTPRDGPEAGRAQGVSLEPFLGYDGEIRHLVAAIADGSTRLDATLDDAVAVAELLDAEGRSLESGKPVSFG